VIELCREPGDGRPLPGVTFRPLARFAARSAGTEVAAATLGLAEVFEREPLEYLVGRLSWTDDPAPVRHVVAAAVAEVPAGSPVHLLTWQDERTEQRRAVAEECGFELFQEKLEFWWPAGDAVADAPPVDVIPMTIVGRDRIESVMRTCVGEILDRTDRAMIARDRDGWVARFLDTHAAGQDRHTWLLGTDHGTPVGFVGRPGASARVDRPASTGRRGEPADAHHDAAHRIRAYLLAQMALLPCLERERERERERAGWSRTVGHHHRVNSSQLLDEPNRAALPDAPTPPNGA
jgi:hypothetical protein